MLAAMGTADLANKRHSNLLPPWTLLLAECQPTNQASNFFALLGADAGAKEFAAGELLGLPWQRLALTKECAIGLGWLPWLGVVERRPTSISRCYYFLFCPPLIYSEKRAAQSNLACLPFPVLLLRFADEVWSASAVGKVRSTYSSSSSSSFVVVVRSCRCSFSQWKMQLCLFAC